jgi:hypothetical protein
MEIGPAEYIGRAFFLASGKPGKVCQWLSLFLDLAAP